MKEIIRHGLNLAALVWLTALPVDAQSPLDNSPATRSSAPIPLDQLGTVATKQYSGDGLSVTATPDGARLRCAFQRLEGEVTRDGLWLRSTVGDAQGERFRVLAVEVGRVTPDAPIGGASVPASWLVGSLAPPTDNDAPGVTRPTEMFPGLSCTGRVSVAENVARFRRDGLTEEYSVAVDGVRQDFIVEQRPEGEGELRVELDVTGAKVEPLVNGARLVLAGSGRKLAYNRLRVTDATGRELPARMEVAAGVSPAVEGAHPAARIWPATFPTRDFQVTPESAGLEAPALRQAGTPAATMLAVVVDDANAIYPVRIDPTFSDADWISMGGLPGANSPISATVVDGSGNIYIGGYFTLVGGEVLANRIAKWDGNAWSALGTGMDSNVLALAVLGTNLYAGGNFTTAGGTAANYIAKWDGSAWSALGSGMSNTVYALAVSGADLYAGGSFTNAGGIAVNRIAKWDGNAWSALGSGMSGDVRALVMSDTDLYAGGFFTTAGGVTALRIAKWDGNAWSALGLGVDNVVVALAVSGTNLFAGGAFTTAGGTTANFIAKWNGNAWFALGSGMNSYVNALAVFGTNLYAGGQFSFAGGIAATNVAQWNGSAWSALGSGIAGTPHYVYALAASGTDLCVGGNFIYAGGQATTNLAKWNGNTWLPWSSGLNNPVYALALSGNDLYAGGEFTAASGIQVDYIAKWNGSRWSSLGSGMDGPVFALTMSGTDLYAGGYFTNAGGTVAKYIAKWDGSAWSALGLGMNDGVIALAVSGTNLYVGGNFTYATNTGPSAVKVNGVAKWDGNMWSTVGAGLYYCTALAVSGTNLYAGSHPPLDTGGSSGPGCGYLAKWDGNAWLQLASWSGLRVGALAVSGTNLYVAGGRYVYKLNGGNYLSALGYGDAMSGYVNALAVSGTNLYAAGAYLTTGNRIAKWDGTMWSALGSGIGGNYSPTVYALVASGTNLFAGGDFTTAGNKISAYVAKANIGAARGRFSDMVYSPATGFSCTFSDGTVGQPYRVQTAPSLAAGPWTDFTNFTYTAPIVITDAAAVAATNTFYRAVTP